MSFFDIFGKPQHGSRSRSRSRDQKSQTDFDFDDTVNDGNNIGIRIDPRNAGSRPRSASSSMPKPQAKGGPKDSDEMLMAERVFYGHTAQDAQWNIDNVNETKEDEAPQGQTLPEKPPEEECNDPCYEKFNKCITVCMESEEDPCEQNKQECEEEPAPSPCPSPRSGRNARRPCNDQCGRGNSRSRERSEGRSEKPRRQCSDLCRVSKKMQDRAPECPRDPCDTPRKDPCDPCATPRKDPCDPCAKPRKDPCFDPCAASDPCDDPCKPPQKQKQRKCPCPPDPCKPKCQIKNPCRDPAKTNDPCDPCAPKDQCEEPCEQDSCEGPCEEEPCDPDATENPDGNRCPPCPPCPVCPECPPCPTNNTSKGYRPCGTRSPQNVPSPTTVSVESADSPRSASPVLSQDYSERNRPVCPEPLFPLCKDSEENCSSIVCSED